ncbi:MAG: AAA family ATPase, partial [Actinomycetota bacterium]|nr:AAA family ATPase [Actinomycetota bacterium]
MKAGKTFYVCSECGESSAQWLGRCPACGSFGTMLKESPEPRGQRSTLSAARPLRMVELGDEAPRLRVGIPELDRVLGGGAVPGSLVLLGGEPGIGKSTLLLQAAHALSVGGARVLLVSGEESAAQIASRARRIGCLHPDLYLLCETDLGRVEEAVWELEPRVVVMDS